MARCSSRCSDSESARGQRARGQTLRGVTVRLENDLRRLDRATEIPDPSSNWFARSRTGRRSPMPIAGIASSLARCPREHPETKGALDIIGAIYAVEHEAKAASIIETAEHLALRKARSRPLFAQLLRWGRRHRHSFEPRSGLGRAIRYLLHNFRELGRFRFATIRPDSNIVCLRQACVKFPLADRAGRPRHCPARRYLV
jgi:hypothetical protein